MSLLDVGIFSNDLLLNGLDILVSNIGHMIIREGHNRRIEWVEKLDRMEWEKKYKIAGGREVGGSQIWEREGQKAHGNTTSFLVL